MLVSPPAVPLAIAVARRVTARLEALDD